MVAERMVTIEKSERCRKDIKHFIKYNRKISCDVGYRPDPTDHMDKRLIRPVFRYRDVIFFGLYINKYDKGKTVQNY